MKTEFCELLVIRLYAQFVIMDFAEVKRRSENSMYYATYGMIKGGLKGLFFATSGYFFAYCMNPRVTKKLGPGGTTAIISAVVVVAGAIQAEKDLLQIERFYRKSDADERNRALAMRHYRGD